LQPLLEFRGRDRITTLENVGLRLGIRQGANEEYSPATGLHAAMFELRNWRRCHLFWCRPSPDPM
jgi:hypothetical protein